MKTKFYQIDRRSFFRTTGSVLTGMTLVPLDIFEENGKSENDNFTGFELTGSRLWTTENRLKMYTVWILHSA
jgi:hypothetical protein